MIMTAHKGIINNLQKQQIKNRNHLRVWNPPCVQSFCYKVIQRFRVAGLFAGQHNTKVHGTITDDMIWGKFTKKQSKGWNYWGLLFICIYITFNYITM